MKITWSAKAVDGLGLDLSRRRDIDLYLKLEGQSGRIEGSLDDAQSVDRLEHFLSTVGRYRP